MDRAEFLAALRQTPRDWRLEPNGEIRRGRKRYAQCPLTALVGLPAKLWYEAECHLALDGMKIMTAADNRTEGDPTLRKELLAACGLKEQA